MKNPRCILLALHPANIDHHNNEVFQLTKDVDENSNRTIPVITKIDLVEPGTEEAVMKLIRGEESKFSLGFSVVKCRTQQQLDKKVSLEKSSQEEQEFFEQRDPWKQLKHKGVLGVPNLIAKLTTLYLEMIQSTMPSVLSELRRKKGRIGARAQPVRCKSFNSKTSSGIRRISGKRRENALFVLHNGTAGRQI
jgi:dynamin 1-like protein